MSHINQKNIRNFCIIAHIDHGKSTLADRLIEAGEGFSARGFHAQMLDSLEIEQERGITIKSQAITIPYRADDGELYELNFVDTPGHVDFTYEVSRAIGACEGALLLIDATQGVQAQTVSNLYLAVNEDLEIIPVVNKMDLPSADRELVHREVEQTLGLPGEPIFEISAKTGLGVHDLFQGILDYIPAPQGKTTDPLKALIFDSHFDAYRGAVMNVRLFEGSVKAGDEIEIFSTKTRYRVEEVGRFHISFDPCKVLEAGDVGYIIAGIKMIKEVRIGDTVTLASAPCEVPVHGFEPVKSVVFSSIYPIDSNDYKELDDSMEKLQLNDASLVFQKDSSQALGFGFRCGFLGLLHLEITQERLEKEFGLSILLTAPSVEFKIVTKKGEEITIDNPAYFPDPSLIEEAKEPFIRASILVLAEYLGPVMQLCTQKRGSQISLNYLDPKRVELIYELPLMEVLFDFYDTLKSITKGYSSFDYEVIEFRPSHLVKLDILVNGEMVDALSQIVYKDYAHEKGKAICLKLKDEIPRQQFKVALQAAIGTTIVARETISPFRKDVIAKCYGGDISRKRKLLEKQKAGKKRMKVVGNVEIPQKAFLSVLRTETKS